MNFRNYEIWHDEYKGDSATNEYWHGILFLPEDKKIELVNLLRIIRKEHGFDDGVNLKFSGCLKKSGRGCCIRDMLNLFQHLLIVREDKAQTDFIYRSGKDIYKKEIAAPFLSIAGLFGCKFALLKVADNHQSMDYFSEYAKKVETTFRFIFKNGCHSFFSENNAIMIKGVYFDGCEHHGRDIDASRIVPRDLRNYVAINKDFIIDARGMDERNDDTKLIINFVDNIIGGLTAKIKNFQDNGMVLHPIRDIYSRLRDNEVFSRTKSRWYQSILASEFIIEGGGIMFPDLFRNKKQKILL